MKTHVCIPYNEWRCLVERVSPAAVNGSIITVYGVSVVAEPYDYKRNTREDLRIFLRDAGLEESTIQRVLSVYDENNT